MSDLKKFCEVTETHGVKHLVSESSSPWRRSLWGVLIGGALIFLAYFFYSRVTAYLRHEVTSLVSVDRTRLYLPSVKVCVTEPQVLDPRRLTADDIINGGRVEDGAAFINQSAVLRHLRGGRYLRKEALDGFKHLLALDKVTEDDLGRWFYVDNMYYMYRGNLVNWRVLLSTLIAHGADVPLKEQRTYDQSDVLSRAQYNYSTHLQCRQLSSTEGGLSEESCTEGWQTVPVNFGSCLMKHHTRQEAVLEMSELAVLREPESLMFPDYVYNLYYVVVEDGQESSVAVIDRSQHAGLSPGTHTVLRVVRRTELRRLGAPFSQCVPGSYSKSECSATCLGRAWRDKYGCVEPHMVHSAPGAPVCSLRVLPDFFTYHRQATTTLMRCEQRCEVPCAEDVYTTAVTESTHRMVMPNNLTGVFLFISSSHSAEVVRLHEIELYPVGSLLAELGGTMGLFVGISVLSIVHLMEYVAARTVRSCREAVSQRRTRRENKSEGCGEGDHPGTSVTDRLREMESYGGKSTMNNVE